MTRSPQDVEAEISALQESGKKNPGKLGALRKELIDSLRAENAALLGRFESGRTEPITFGSPPERAPMKATYSRGASDSVLAPDPLSTDEWAFAEKACAELELDLTKGVTTDLVKKLYNQIDAKVKAWRIIRAVVKGVGTGVAWPQFNALGIGSSLGEALHGHSVLSDDWEPGYTSKPEPAAPAEAPPPAPTITEGGMPIREGAPNPADILSGVTGGDPRVGIMADVESRPEPVREPEPAV